MDKTFMIICGLASLTLIFTTVILVVYVVKNSETNKVSKSKTENKSNDPPAITNTTTNTISQKDLETLEASIINKLNSLHNKDKVDPTVDDILALLDKLMNENNELDTSLDSEVSKEHLQQKKKLQDWFEQKIANLQTDSKNVVPESSFGQDKLAYIADLKDRLIEKLRSYANMIPNPLGSQKTTNGIPKVPLSGPNNEETYSRIENIKKMLLEIYNDYNPFGTKQALKQKEDNNKPIKKTIKDPEEPIKNPEEPIKNPEEPIKNPEEPIKNPEEPIKDPEEPIKDPEEPIKDPEEPIKDPEEPIKDPEVPIKDPEEPIENPEVPIKDPEEPIENPEEPIKDPEEPIKNPEEPIKDPEEPIKNPEVPIKDPEEPIEPQPTKKSTGIKQNSESVETNTSSVTKSISESPLIQPIEFKNINDNKTLYPVRYKLRASGRNGSRSHSQKKNRYDVYPKPLSEKKVNIPQKLPQEIIQDVSSETNSQDIHNDLPPVKKNIENEQLQYDIENNVTTTENTSPNLINRFKNKMYGLGQTVNYYNPFNRSKIEENTEETIEETPEDAEEIFLDAKENIVDDEAPKTILQHIFDLYRRAPVNEEEILEESSEIESIKDKNTPTSLLQRIFDQFRRAPVKTEEEPEKEEVLEEITEIEQNVSPSLLWRIYNIIVGTSENTSREEIRKEVKKEIKKENKKSTVLPKGQSITNKKNILNKKNQLPKIVEEPADTEEAQTPGFFRRAANRLYSFNNETPTAEQSVKEDEKEVEEGPQETPQVQDPGLLRRAVNKLYWGEPSSPQEVISQQKENPKQINNKKGNNKKGNKKRSRKT
ncbi:putative surface protein bspA-like [Nosema granulosis]|uniref:Surface protein bspA-like n=1 Tax=Nosema granulosis TaxID=83296 RepID=A0A9P6GXY0_9MICR|nr:putative surface protein bspA-like [Nosema granulosis]